MKTVPLPPAWVKLTPESRKFLREEYLKAWSQRASKEWLWFCDMVDYREMCSRTSQYWTWRTLLVRGLLWAAES